MKALGKKPPNWDGTSLLQEHYRQALLEAAEYLEFMWNFHDSLKQMDQWQVKLAKQLRISAGDDE